LVGYIFKRTSEIKARVACCFLPTDEFPMVSSEGT
jgi:hypothetical protein